MHPIRIMFGENGDNKKMAEHGYPNGMTLMATSFQMDVERKFQPFALPLSGGSRMGIDMNSVNSAIQIEGVFVDDTDSDLTEATSATAEIDTAFDYESKAKVGQLYAVSTSKYAELYSLRLRRNSNIFTITFAEHATAPIGFYSTTSTSTNKVVIVKSGSTYATAEEVATGIAAGINHNNDFPFTGSTATSKLRPSEGATRVLIVTDATGADANEDHEIEWYQASAAAANSLKLYFTSFSGARDASSVKSAGDKMQDLYGIVHNSIKPGAALVGGAVAGAALAFATGGTALAAAGILGGTGVALAPLLRNQGDYPTRIVIPYNSTVTAEGGDLYAVRHLFIPYGIGKRTENKLSTSNDTNVDKDGNTKSIAGGIKSLTIGYEAGETVYSFRMTYLPANLLL